MHKWKIEIILKCGKEVVGYHEESGTMFEVTKSFICSDICAITDKDKKNTNNGNNR